MAPPERRSCLERFVRSGHRALCIWMFVLCTLYGVAAQCATIAVLYPDVPEPYLSVFLTILQGVKARVNGTIEPRALAQDFDPDQVRDWLREHKADAIIALGQRGLQAAKAIDTELPVVTGALLLTPKLNGDSFTGISLAPDPARLFGQLKSLAPDVKRVFVVYNPEENAWLLDLAEKAARTRGLKLHSYDVQDLRTAVQHYRDILREAKDGTDALWLPPDSTTVDDSVVLPMVLEAAWDKRLPVFSSNPAHVQRGVLFALYPDNLALGRRLAQLALDKLGGRKQPAGVLPLRDLRVAVNLRTAAHLGLVFTPRQQREFDLVFPSP